MVEPREELIGILTRHLEPCIGMLEEIVDDCPDELWVMDQKGAPIWRHVYHTVVGIDFWFRGSKNDAFDFLTFGKSVEPDLEKPSRDRLTRKELKRCIARTRVKLSAFVKTVHGEGLCSKSELTEVFTKADLLLMQIRHFQHHIGYCNALMRSNGAEAAKWLEYGDQS
jgi:hypothetical protein